MKAKMIVVCALLLLPLLTVSARANDIWDYTATADCEGWTVSGILVLVEDVDLCYDIKLVQGTDTVATASGVETIPRSAAAPFSLDGIWDMELCGDYSVEGIIYFYSVQTPYEEARFSIPTFTCECDTPEYCNHTPGFWKNHPDSWPVESLEIGCDSYTKAELISILNMPIKHNKLLIMVHHLIAAKLNVLAGSDDSIMGAISNGDALLCSLDRIFGRVDKTVKANLVGIKNYLADYNEMGCPGDEIDEFGIFGSKIPGSAAETFGAEEETSWGALKNLPE